MTPPTGEIAAIDVAVSPAGAAAGGDMRRGAVLVTGSQIVTAVAGALLSVVMARILGADGVGLFNVAQSALLIVGTFATLGIEIGITYYVGGGRWSPVDALRQAQLAAAALGLLGVGAGLVVAKVGAGSAFEGLSTGEIAIALAALPFLLSWTYSAFLALAIRRYGIYGLGPATQAVAALALAGAGAAVDDLRGALIGLAASHVVCALGILGWGARQLPAPDRAWLGGATGRLRVAGRFGMKAYLANALQLINYRADLFVLNAVASSAKVGQYAIALSVTSLGLFLPRAVSAVILPRVASLGSGAEEGDQAAVVGQSVRHIVVLSIASALALAVGLLFIPLVYGPEFRAAIGLGLLLLPGIAALGVASVLSAAIVGNGRPEYSLYTAAIITPVTLGLYLLAIPPLGATGAALASSLSYGLTSLVTLLFFLRLPVRPAGRELVPGRREWAEYRALAARLRPGGPRG